MKASKVKISRLKSSILLLSLGGALGFFVLHPIAIFVDHFFEHDSFTLTFYAAEVFGFKHIPMAFFFGGIGILFSVSFVFYLGKIMLLNETLMESNKKLQALDALKSEFVSKVTHELRTPLSAIKGSIDLVLEGFTGTINPEQRKFLSSGSKNIARLGRIIKDILDFQKYGSPKSDFSLHAVAVEEIIKDAVETQGIVASGKGLYLKDSHIDEGARVLADRERVLQVLNNLINNAIKFTDKGGITISAKEDESEIIIAVADTGIGISDEDIPRLFKEFAQVGAVRLSGSTGLGLAICKKIVENHGGRIWAESSPGKGSTFSFTLRKAFTDGAQSVEN